MYPITRKILAVKLRAIGDTVIWTSALQSFRDANPDVEIHVLTYESNSAVLHGHPAVSERHYLSGHSRGELLRTLWKLRGKRFDWLLGFHATTSLCRWAWLVGAKKKVLHHHSWRKTPRGSVTIPNPGELEDAIKRDHRVLEAVGITAAPAPTKIWISPGESKLAEQKVVESIQAAKGDASLPRYLFLPGAGHHLRRYPKEMWLPLAEKMLREKKYQPIVIVDEALSHELDLRVDCKRLNLPLLDQGNLREFIRYVSRGNFALGNDSGPSHIAVALGLQTTFVFGPGCVGDWHPYDRKTHPLFRTQVPCRGEGPRDREEFQFCTVDRCTHHRCMRELFVTT